MSFKHGFFFFIIYLVISSSGFQLPLNQMTDLPGPPFMVTFSHFPSRHLPCPVSGDTCWTLCSSPYVDLFQ